MQKPRVLVTRHLPAPALDLLARTCDLLLDPDDRPLSAGELCRRIRGCEGLVCLLTDRISRDVIDAGDKLKIIANVAVGTDNIDLAAASARHIAVTNTPDVLTDATADLALALMLAVARRIVEADDFLRAGRFRGWHMELLVGVDVSGATLGIVGFGRIGRAVAKRARDGFGMRVLVCDSDLNAGAGEFENRRDGVEFCALPSLLRRADFVSLHVPLSASTRHLIGENEFAAMKPSAILINTARGPVVDETALVAALNAGQIRGAGLDVFENEPAVAPGLLALKNVVLTPHIGSATIATRTRMATLAAENLLAGLRGETPPQLVNAPRAA